MNQNKRDFAKVKKILDFVWENPHSDFYRKKYCQAKIHLSPDVLSLEDFQKLPFLTREEIILTDPYERMFLPREDYYRIKISSGTTHSKKPLIIFYSAEHPLQSHYWLDPGFKGEVKSLMQLGNLMTSQAKPSARPRKDSTEGFFLTLGDSNNLELTAQIASQIRIDGLRTTPTTLYFFIPFLKKYYDTGKIKYIHLSGEYCSEQKALFLKKEFKNAHFYFLFTSIETGILGYRCPTLQKTAPRFFHPLPIFYYELLHPEKESELIITHLFQSSGFPLIRYRTGNSVSLTNQRCPCGNNRMMEVFGRIGVDSLTIQGTTLYTEHISEALSPFYPILSSPDFQMHVFEKIIKGKIIISLELHLPLKDTAEKTKRAIASSVSQRLFLSPQLNLEALVKRGIFSPLKVVALDHVVQSGKSKPIISHLT